MLTSEQLTSENCTVVEKEVESMPIAGSETHVMVAAFHFDSRMKQVTPRTITAQVPITSKVFHGKHDPKKQWCFVVDRYGKATLRAVTRNSTRAEKKGADLRSSASVDLTADESLDASIDVTEDMEQIHEKLDRLAVQVEVLARLLDQALNLQK